jgi:hypothetical protein
MTVSNFNMMSKGAAKNTVAPDNNTHEFTYVLADEKQANFHAFFDEHESWINHRDNGTSMNCDAEMVQKLLTGSPKNIA